MRRKDFVTMNLPSDTSLPFFAYGIFKPGQLCFYRIRNLVDTTTEYTVNGHLKERDGIPLLLLQENCSKIKGCLISFQDGKENEAYIRIMEIEPDSVYRWEHAVVNGLDTNVLVGKKVQRGSTDLEHIDEWDGRSDPYFKQGLEVIEEVLKENSNFDWDFKPLLRLQMAYTLLWTAIERYASLKYHLGKNVTNKVHQIAEEKCFCDAIKKIVKNKREVYSTTDFRKYTLDPDDAKKSIKYYYQVRSNAIHRGKAVVNDFGTIKSSLEELLAIFKILLDESFQQ